MSISKQLKQAIRQSDLTVRDLAKRIGIDHAALVRFISKDPDQHRDIRLESTADKIAKYFGLRLTSRPFSKKKSSR